MKESNTDLIQGTLDMLILKTLSLGALHGFGIARRIEQVSNGVFKVNPARCSRLSSGSNVWAGWIRNGARQTTRAGEILLAYAFREEATRSREGRLEPAGRGYRETTQGGGIIRVPMAWD